MIYVEDERSFDTALRGTGRLLCEVPRIGCLEADLIIAARIANDANATSRDDELPPLLRF